MKRNYLPIEATGFEWDDNISKNWEKHRVTHFECEEIFFNSPFFVSADLEHSRDERRYFALGFTDRGRYLFVAFTMRETQIRAISFRDMTERERRIYEHHKKK